MQLPWATMQGPVNGGVWHGSPASGEQLPVVESQLPPV